MKMTYIIRLIVIFVSKQTKWWSQHVIYTQADFLHPIPPLLSLSHLVQPYLASKEVLSDILHSYRMGKYSERRELTAAGRATRRGEFSDFFQSLNKTRHTRATKLSIYILYTNYSM